MMSGWSRLNSGMSRKGGGEMIQITNRGRIWWLLKDKKVVGFASTYKYAKIKAKELEGVIYERN